VGDTPGALCGRTLLSCSRHIPVMTRIFQDTKDFTVERFIAEPAQ
jgi:hypothetical protein